MGSASQPTTPLLVRLKTQWSASSSARPPQPTHQPAERLFVRAPNGQQRGRTSEHSSRISAPASPHGSDEHSADSDVFVSAPATPRSRSGSSARPVPPDISQLIRELSQSAGNSPQATRRKPQPAVDEESSSRRYYRYRSSRSPSNERTASSSRRSLANTEYDEQLGDFGDNDNDTLTASRQAVGEPEEPETDFQTRWTITKERLKDWDDEPQPRRAAAAAAVCRGQSAPASPAVQRRAVQPKPQSQRSRTPSASGALRQPVPQWDAPTAAADYLTSRSHQSLPARPESPPPELSLPSTQALLPSCLALFDELRDVTADDPSDQNLSRAVSLLNRVLVRPPLTALLVYRTAFYSAASLYVYKANFCRLVENVPRSHVNICSFSFSSCRSSRG